MASITVFANLVTILSTERYHARRPVTFEGAQVGQPYHAGGGEVQTLYRTDKDVLLVHVRQGAGEAQEVLYRLTDLTALQPGGRFEALGRAAGIAEA